MCAVGAAGFLRYLVVTHNPEHGIMGVTSSNLSKHGSEVLKLSFAGACDSDPRQPTPDTTVTPAWDTAR